VQKTYRLGLVASSKVGEGASIKAHVMGGFDIKRNRRYVESPKIRRERELMRGTINLIMCLYLREKNIKPSGTIRGSRIRATNLRGGGTEYKAVAAYNTHNHEPNNRLRASKIRCKGVHNFVQCFRSAARPSIEAKNGRSQHGGTPGVRPALRSPSPVDRLGYKYP
jgi:hypothetical protein